MKSVYKILPKLVRASLQGDQRVVENATLSMLRKIKKDYPDIAEELSEILAYQGAGANLTRSVGIEPPPKDSETNSSLVTIEEINDFEGEYFLPEEAAVEINNFIEERELSAKLLSKGVSPPNSILLYGAPGVGKTELAKYISYRLSKPLINLDLASNISSYLGKTGQNLKNVLDYAKSKPTILFLDEFDAIAKKRDDSSDLGELKRIVNVLLKELESWPHHSVFIAATNHPEILDKAIWRRFDRSIEIGLPDYSTRTSIWKKYLNSSIIEYDKDFLGLISDLSDGYTPADIQKLSERVLRQVIIQEVDPYKEVLKYLRDKKHPLSKSNKVLVKKIYDYYKGRITQSEIAAMLGISASTVNHHLKNREGQ